MSLFMKCDAEGCDHRETVPEMVPELIGTPCPKCGANLMTQEDFDYFVNTVLPSLNVMKLLGLVRDVTEEDADGPALQVGTHEGEINIQVVGTDAAPA
ncbi:MAG: hypothetical protein AB8B85_04130 [Paracoccaceae bacterium]